MCRTMDMLACEYKLDGTAKKPNPRASLRERAPYGARINMKDASFPWDWLRGDIDFYDLSQDDKLIWMKKYIYEVSHSGSPQNIKDVQVSRWKKKLLMGELDLMNIELYYNFEGFKFQHRNHRETQTELTAKIDERDDIIKRHEETIATLETSLEKVKRQFKCAQEYGAQKRNEVKRLKDRLSRR